MESRLTRSALLRGAAAAAAVAGLPACVGSGAPTTVRRRRRHRSRRPSLAELRGELSGGLLEPGQPGFREAHRVYNARDWAVRPLAIARVSSEDAVRTVVRWAARAGVPLVARGGGHSYAGYSAGPGLVCDVGRLSAIAIAPDGRSATVGAGCRLVDVVDALAARGLAIPCGSCPTVGIAGSALGGGVGLASRLWGTTSDNVLGLRVVTADGRLVEAGPHANEPLYWACRGGGGGNFGVVTAFTVATHPAPSGASVFVDWPWGAAADAVDAWQRFAPEAPDELSLICSLGTDAGTPRVRVFGQLLGGDATAVERLVGPLTAAGGSVAAGTHSYLDLQRIWAGCAGESTAACAAFRPTPFAGRSDYVATPLPAAGIAAAVHALEARQADGAGTGALLLDPYGGALNRPAADATAFVHRDQRFSCQYLAYWTAPGGGAAADRWLSGFRAAMAPFVSGQAYQNYIDPTLTDWPTAYYGGNLARLRDVKAAVDPHGVLRFRQGI